MLMGSALLCLIVAISDGDTITARCPTRDAAHPYQQVKIRLAHAMRAISATRWARLLGVNEAFLWVFIRGALK